MRFVDFAMMAQPATAFDSRLANGALFAFFEPVRLWVRRQKIEAPFRKLVVSFAERQVVGEWDGHVEMTMNVCQVLEAVDGAAMIADSRDVGWAAARVRFALDCVERELGWRSSQFDGFIASIVGSPLPLTHTFDELGRNDARSKLACVPWISFRVGETRFGVTIGDRETVVLCRQGPLLLDAEFPVAKSAIRAGRFVLLDKSGRELAGVVIDAEAAP